MSLQSPTRSSFFAYGSEFFEISDEDSGDATTQYYGYVNNRGYWIIQKAVNTGSNVITYRYVSGKSAYATNWTNRAGLAYDYIQNIVGLIN